MTTDHIPLVVIFKKGVASLLHTFQRILLWIHQYNTRILYKPVPKLFTADWLFRHNHETNRADEIPGMHIATNAIELCTDIADCMRASLCGYGSGSYMFLGSHFDAFHPCHSDCVTSPTVDF